MSRAQLTVGRGLWYNSGMNKYAVTAFAVAAALAGAWMATALDTEALRKPFGIYLLHVMFLMPLLRTGGDALYGPGVAVLCAIGLYLISFFVTWALSLIPGVGKVLFHTRPWNLMRNK